MLLTLPSRPAPVWRGPLLWWVLVAGALSGRPAAAQTFHGRNLKWAIESPDPRLTLLFGTTGLMGGYEGTAVVTENTTDTDLAVELALTITDYCGTATKRQVRVRVPAHGRVGGSTWMGGDEQYDYSSKCATTQTYGSSFRTRIARVSLSIVSVKVIPPRTPGSGPGSTPPTSGNNGSTGNGSSTGSNGSAGNGGNSGNNGSGTTGTGNNNGSGTSNGGTSGAGTGSATGLPVSAACPVFGFSAEDATGLTCAVLRWNALPTGTNTAAADGTVRTTRSPEYTFIVQYREAGELLWRESRVNRAGLVRFSLGGLNPCSRYEARLITICDGSTASVPTATLHFGTNCQAPAQVQVTAVTAASASLSSRRSIPLSCSPTVRVTTEVEYRTATGAWQTTSCPSGSPCQLTGLQPATSYRLRLRYRYDNRFYSDYSAETGFRTTN
jgi:hypothetical protein